MSIKFKRQKRFPTADDLRNIAGTIDESLIGTILDTGATLDEITQAFLLLEEDHYTRPIFTREMEGRIRRVYDILDYAHNGFVKSER